MELIEICAKASADEMRHRLIQSAYVGWQMLGMQPRRAGAKLPNFQDYCRELGLVERPALRAPVRAIEDALKAQEKVRKAFDRGA
jgi:hypothetical protein